MLNHKYGNSYYFNPQQTLSVYIYNEYDNTLVLPASIFRCRSSIIGNKYFTHAFEQSLYYYINLIFNNFKLLKNVNIHARIRKHLMPIQNNLKLKTEQSDFQ